MLAAQVEPREENGLHGAMVRQGHAVGVGQRLGAINRRFLCLGA